MKELKALCALIFASSCGGSTPAATSDGGGATDDATNLETDAPSSVDDGPTHVTVDADLTAATNDRCTDALPINMTTMHADIPATTVGASADLTAPCGSASRPDVFFKFTLTRRQMVYADTFGGTGASTLYFASSCTAPISASTTLGDAVCSAGACGTTQAQVAALLDPGTYYLVLAGTGPTTIHFQHLEVGTGAVAPLASGSTSNSGTTAGFGSMYQCDAGGPENAYWWKTCPSNPGGAFMASTCAGTDFDTILSLQLPTSEAVMCDDDTCSFQSSIGATLPAGAGLFVVAVDGFSSAKRGTYTLSATRP